MEVAAAAKRAHLSTLYQRMERAGGGRNKRSSKAKVDTKTAAAGIPKIQLNDHGGWWGEGTAGCNAGEGDADAGADAAATTNSAKQPGPGKHGKKITPNGLWAPYNPHDSLIITNDVSLTNAAHLAAQTYSQKQILYVAICWRVHAHVRGAWCVVRGACV